MPGLSQFKPQQTEEPLIVDVAPPITSDNDLPPGADPDLLNRMRQRYEESLGFADLKRIAPDWMQREMLDNIPRDQWDRPIKARTQGESQEIAPDWWINTPELSEKFTFRELMELLNQLIPNERQSP